MARASASAGRSRRRSRCGSAPRPDRPARTPASAASICLSVVPYSATTCSWNRERIRPSIASPAARSVARLASATEIRVPSKRSSRIGGRGAWSSRSDQRDTAWTWSTKQPKSISRRSELSFEPGLALEASEPVIGVAQVAQRRRRRAARSPPRTGGRSWRSARRPRRSALSSRASPNASIGSARVVHGSLSDWSSSRR